MIMLVIINKSTSNSKRLNLALLIFNNYIYCTKKTRTLVTHKHNIYLHTYLCMYVVIHASIISNKVYTNFIN